MFKKALIFFLSAVLLCGTAFAETLVIDAGHGGADGGASTDSGVCESTINLEIAQKLEAIACLLGVDTVMTRETDEIAYPESADTIAKKKVFDQKSRVKLINGVDNAVLISIHQNKYPDPGPSGAQALYGKVSGSMEFGELMHQNLTDCLCPGNRRVAAPISDDIYLMRSVECPSVLVECGFLSNPDEASLLQTKDYQIKLAVVLAASFIQFIRQ